MCRGRGQTDHGRPLVTKPDVAIAIPAYNEADGIGEFLLEIDEALKSSVSSLTIVVADDASIDDTVDVVTAAGEKTAATVEVLRAERNRGHGPTLMRAYERALTLAPDVVLQVDGDGQFLGADLRRLLVLLEDGAESVCGVRRFRYDPWVRMVMTRALRSYVSVSFGIPTRDANCPLRGYRSSVLAELLPLVPAESLVPNLCLTILASRRRSTMVEVDVSHRVRRGSSATGTTWTSARRSVVPWLLLRFAARAFRELRQFRASLDPLAECGWSAFRSDDRDAVAEVGCHESIRGSSTADDPRRGQSDAGYVGSEPFGVVPNGESLRVRAHLDGLEAVLSQRKRERRPGEVLQVHRQHRPPPAAQRPRETAPGVGDRDEQHPGGRQCPVQARQRGTRISQMLEDVAGDDRVERLVVELDVVERGEGHVASALASPSRRPLRRFDAFRDPAAFVRGDEERSGPRTDFEEACRTRPPLDAFERTSRRLDLPCFLTQRHGIRSFDVRVRHRVAPRELGHHGMAAGTAPEDATDRVAELVCARQERSGIDAGLRGAAGGLPALDEIGSATDRAACTRHPARRRRTTEVAARNATTCDDNQRHRDCWSSSASVTPAS